MIDFLKADIIGVEPALIRENALLDFKNLIGEDTGELGHYAWASYRGLLFKIYYPTPANPDGRITLEGSLHKYFNRGLHNFNDFDMRDLNGVLVDIEQRFGITPSNKALRQMEIGVNLILQRNPDDIINSLIMHKKDRFESKYNKDEGTYYQVTRSEKLIKVYNKTKHYRRKGMKVPDNIFRFEIKYNAMRELKKKHQRKVGFIDKQRPFTMADLLAMGLPEIALEILPFEWSQVLFFDEGVLKVHPKKDKYGSIRFWEGLKAENFKYHRRLLNEIYAKHPINKKAEVGRIIKSKIRALS